VATTVTPDQRTQARTIEDERPWTAGSVWSVDFIRVKPGRNVEYARVLKETWAKVLEEQKKEGLVLSYKILGGMPSNREEFTHVLMVEYPNYAAFDQQDKFDAVLKRTIGSLGSFQEMMREREEFREALGTRLLREFRLK
jgi:hypothetical protein